MSAEIINLAERRHTETPEYVWQCGCQGQTFLMMVDGSVVCAECDCIQSSLRYFRVCDRPLKP